GIDGAPRARGTGPRLAARRVLLGTVVTALAAVAAVRRVQVQGDSMVPTLLPGERLLVVKARRARPGQLVVVHDPRSPRRALVKRVVSVAGALAEVAGDNAAASTDSTVFGPVRVRGRVVYRYHPGERAGRLG
ncbi:MAG TPA: S26 family signal peptidase, partial [Nonomuraea sp.]|nr:S26 family signal peptidase [Nonomuraea sp.]